MLYFKIDFDSLKTEFLTQETEGYHYVIAEKENIQIIAHLQSQKDKNILLNNFEFNLSNTHISRDLNNGYWILIFDKKNKTITIERDIFGQKPLYYFRNNSNIYFSESIAKLAQISNYKPNQAYIYKFLKQNFYNESISEETFYDNIFRILPATNYQFSKEKITRKKTELIPAKVNSNSFSGILNSKLQDINENQNTSIHISGGLDSAAIFTHSNSETQGLFFDTNEPKNIDKKYLQLIENKYPNTIEKIIDTNTFSQNLKESISYSKLPESIILPLHIFEILHQKSKHTNVLSGHGGDNTLTYGYEYLDSLLINEKYEELETQIPKYYDAKKDIWNQHYKITESNQLLEWLINKNLTQNYEQISIKLALKLLFKFKISLNSFIKYFLKKCLSNFKVNNNIFYNNQLQSCHTNVFVNYIEAIQSLDFKYNKNTKYPFLDKKIIAFVNTQDPKINYANGFGRGFLREALKPYFSSELYMRTSKGDFGWYARNYVGTLIEETQLDQQIHHIVWKYAKKIKYNDAVLKIKNDNFTFNEINNEVWYCQKVINLAIWLEQLPQY